MNISYLIVIVLVAAVANLVEARESTTNRGLLATFWPWGNSIGRHQEGNAPGPLENNSGNVADDGRNEELNSRNQESLQASMDPRAENVHNTEETEFFSQNRRPDKHQQGSNVQRRDPTPREIFDHLNGIRYDLKSELYKEKIKRQKNKFAQEEEAFNNREKQRGFGHKVARFRLRRNEKIMSRNKAKYKQRIQEAKNRRKQLAEKYGEEIFESSEDSMND